MTRIDRITGADGQALVVVRPALNPAFARACLRAWSASDGVDRNWMQSHGAINVPAEHLPAARRLLESWGEPTAQCEALSEACAQPDSTAADIEVVDAKGPVS